MGLKVIGTGYGRTGTDSLREALNMLGFGPCHHMLEVNASDEQKRLWRALARGENPGWDKLFAGYSACVDWPSAHYWRELVDVYPDAKVVLTYRSPESWWESLRKRSCAASPRAPTLRRWGSPSSATRCSAASRATARTPSGSTKRTSPP